jgi:thiamine-monophosphate kinase
MALPGEDALIQRLAAGLPPAWRTQLGIGDDAAAILEPDGSLLLITTDMLMEGVHFRLTWGDLPALGWKALAQNLSDIAAMGGIPTQAVIAIAVPPDMPADDVARIYQGLGALAGEAGVDIVGGDTIKSAGPLILAITVLGRAADGELLTRAGARPGEALFVTGALGRAAAGLRALESGLPIPDTLMPAVSAQLRPQPRLAAARALAVDGRVTAMMDLSDGVATDLHRLCRASGVGAIVEVAAVPVDPVVVATGVWLALHGIAVDNFTLALAGGEDFELLLTAPADAEDALRAAIAPLPLTRIGAITPGEAVLLREDDRLRPLEYGFTHF